MWIIAEQTSRLKLQLKLAKRLTSRAEKNCANEREGQFISPNAEASRKTALLQGLICKHGSRKHASNRSINEMGKTCKP